MQRTLRAAGLAIGPGRVIAALRAHPDLTCLAILLILSGSLRLAFIPGAPAFIHGDSPTYYGPADALVNGQEFPLDLKRPPLYSAFIALVVRGLGEDLTTLVAVQHALGVGTALLTYVIGWLAMGRVVGLLAGAAAGLSGGLLLDEHSVMSEALFTFLLVLAVALGLLGVRRKDPWSLLFAGLAVGLAALTRPHAQLLLLAIPAVAAARGLGWRLVARGIALMTLGATVLLVPWMARNQAVHASFTVAGGLGQHLVNQMADLHGDSYVFYDWSDPPEHPDARRVQARRYIQARIDKEPRTVETTGRRIHERLMERFQLGYVETDTLMRDVALDVLREQPLVFVRATGENLGRNLVGSSEGLRSRWSGWRTPGWPEHLRHLLRTPTPEQTAQFADADRLVRIYDGRVIGELVTGFFVVGLVASLVRPAWRPALLPGMVVVLLHGLTALVAGYESRHYNPTSPLMHVVAFGGLVQALAAVRSITPQRLRYLGLRWSCGLLWGVRPERSGAFRPSVGRDPAV